MPDWLRSVEEGTVISLHVQPRASRNEIIGEQDGALKVRLTSPPVEGAANKLCCEIFAKTCGVPKRNVSILSGEKSRQKRLLVSGLSVAVVQEKIEEQIKR
ncbi:MAG: YggU family protein [Desulfuromonas sp.]|nr:MAG: YggU family protein [Desulfuromonas sp.]